VIEVNERRLFGRTFGTAFGDPDLVQLARAFGIACDRRGQQLVAVVVSNDRNLTPVGLRRLCAATLPPFKIPRRFVFLDALPRTSTDKVDYQALVRLATG